ncbi:MAG: hypothetical protein R3D59_04310 [Paracoccaceae bacterium]
MGAEPVFVPAEAGTGFLPDFSAVPKDVLNRTAAAYLCSPSNPQGRGREPGGLGRTHRGEQEKYDFRIFADECYSEIYRDTPPPVRWKSPPRAGPILNGSCSTCRPSGPTCRACARGSWPAAQSLARAKRLRAYGGRAALAAAKRVRTGLGRRDVRRREPALYQEKYRIADAGLCRRVKPFAPAAGFFLWLPVEDGEAAAMKLWTETESECAWRLSLSRDTAQGNRARDTFASRSWRRKMKHRPRS